MPVWFMWVLFLWFVYSMLAYMYGAVRTPAKPPSSARYQWAAIESMLFALLTLWFIAGGGK